MLMNKKIIFSLVFVLALSLLALPFISHALVAKSGDTVTVNEVVDGNFFAAGNMVTIAGTVNGDVFAAGNNVSITGTVNGDVFVAGSSIDISGKVNGNIRAAGSNISIRGAVERNVMAAGANMFITPTASIGRHVTFTGATVSINAPIGGQLDGAVESMTIDSTVSGEVALDLGSDGKLVLGPNAYLGSSLEYTSKNEAIMDDKAVVIGDTIYNPVTKGAPVDKGDAKKFFALGFFVTKVISLISLFILGLVLILMAPKAMDKYNDIMAKKFWAKVGLGLVILIVTPIVAILLLVTIIGIPLGIITLLVYGIFLYVAKALAALALGKFITDYFKWKIHLLVSFALGLVLMSLIVLIPVIGWIFSFIIFLWAIGGWAKLKHHYLKEFK